MQLSIHYYIIIYYYSKLDYYNPYRSYWEKEKQHQDPVAGALVLMC